MADDELSKALRRIRALERKVETLVDATGTRGEVEAREAEHQAEVGEKAAASRQQLTDLSRRHH